MMMMMINPHVFSTIINLFLFEVQNVYHKMYLISFLRLGRGVSHPPLLASKLQEEWRCASTPILVFFGLSRATFIFAFFNVIYFSSLPSDMRTLRQFEQLSL
jgi:hypothetical protein